MKKATLLSVTKRVRMTWINVYSDKKVKVAKLKCEKNPKNSTKFIRELF